MKTGTRYFVLGAFFLLALPIRSFGYGINFFNSAGIKLLLQIDSLRTEVFVKIVYDNRLVTPVVDVFVNGQEVEAVFDSGSSGLRVLKGALPGQLTDSAKHRVGYTYGDSERNFGIRGRVALVDIRLGDLRSEKPIPIMCIDSTRYGRKIGWTPTDDSTTIQTKHFRDVPAIIGVGLRLSKTAKGVANPLAQLPGNGKYIIRFPHFGGTKGVLIVNPDTTDLKGFTLFKLESGKTLLPNGDSSWRDNELLGCIIINGQQACQPTMLDTGNPDTHVESKNFTGNRSVAIGNRVAMILKDKLGVSQPVQTTFNISNMREDGKDFVFLDETTGLEKNIFGTRFFFDFDVLYDQVKGVIGIKKKS